MKKILYLYTSGRKERLDDLKFGNAPRDFLYGYTYLKNQGLDVDYLETDHFPQEKQYLEYWKLFYRNKKFARQLGIGNRSHYYINQLKRLNAYDVIIATTDSIALGLAYFKQQNRLSPNIIYLNMGLVGALERMKRSDGVLFNEYKEMCSRYIQQCRLVWSAGKREEQFFSSEYERCREKFVYSPWGIDIEFWKPDTSLVNKEKRILFVGNDRNRDFNQVLEISRQRPDIQFNFVTLRIDQSNCGPNVRLYQGSLTNRFLSDLELRTLYNESALVILPLSESLQPSGQSVSLQAMACGRPVAITKTSGLWDLTLMRNEENCLLITTGVKGFVDVIDELDYRSNYFYNIGNMARKTIVKHLQTPFGSEFRVSTHQALDPVMRVTSFFFGLRLFLDRFTE